MDDTRRRSGKVNRIRAGPIVGSRSPSIRTIRGASLASAQTPPWVAVADGTLDSRFGDGDIVTRPGAPGLDDVAIQADGRILVLGGPRVSENPSNTGRPSCVRGWLGQDLNRAQAGHLEMDPEFSTA